MALHLALRMVRQQEVAEELVQEAMLEAYLSLSSLRQLTSFSAWLYGIVLNVCRSYLRAHQVETLSLEAMTGGLLFDALPFASGEPDPYRVVEARELQQLVLQAVDALSPRNRAATLLFYYEQLSVREIALLLGISVTAVKGRLHKSRQQLRHQLAVLGSPYQEVNATRRESAMATETITESVPEKIRVTVADVVVNQESGHYSVVLLDEANRRILPFWCGPFEGAAIAMRQLERPTPRPMTHAFLANMLTTLHVALEEVQIVAIREITFYAIVKLRLEDAVYEVDARPSDAIALALQMQAPIYVAAEVMAQSGVAVPAEYDLATQRKGLQKISEIMDAEFQENERKMQEAKEEAAKREEGGMTDARQKLMQFLFDAAA